jgi:hypothetical protein
MSGVGALALSGAHRGEECSYACGVALFGAAGFGLGMLGAMVTDWVTAREPARPAAAEPGGRAWAPVLVLGPRIKAAGVLVRF